MCFNIVVTLFFRTLCRSEPFEFKPWKTRLFLFCSFSHPFLPKKICFYFFYPFIIEIFYLFFRLVLLYLLFGHIKF
ncbi:MAG: hypothetical protein B6D45_04990 [Ignavibacteriales bacterium UTCHB3]|nr:MAG: hypothetical protein B6D45_04990 [Ignavibacteriales bacterium UTCHB3]